MVPLAQNFERSSGFFSQCDHAAITKIHCADSNPSMVTLNNESESNNNFWATLSVPEGHWLKKES